MRTVTFIILVLLSQNAAASIFSDFQSAISSVGESLGKLVTDVVSDVKDTVDCTIMAVERVLAIGGIMENNPEYDQRCKSVENTTTSEAQPDMTNTDNSQPNTEIIEVTMTNPPQVENIEDNVTNINMYISDVDCNTDGIDIVKAQEALQNRTQHLKEISALLKQRFEKLSEEMKNTIEKKLENDTIALIREIWKELSIVTDLKRKTNNNSEDKNLNEVVDQVLGLFKAKETSNETLTDKIEALRDDLQKEANITLSEVHFPENELKSDKKIDENLNLTFLETSTDQNIIQNNSSYQSEEDRPLELSARNVLENEYPDYSEIAEDTKRFNDNYYSEYGEPTDSPNNEDLNNGITTSKPYINDNLDDTISSNISNIDDNFYDTPASVTEYGSNIYNKTLMDNSTPTNVLFTDKVLENNLISTTIQLENLATTTPSLVHVYDYVLSSTLRPMSVPSIIMIPEIVESTTNIDNPFMTTTEFDEFSFIRTADPIETQTPTEIPEIILTNLPESAYSEINTESTTTEKQTTEIVTDIVATITPTNSLTLSDSQINNIASTTAIDPGTYFAPEDYVTVASQEDFINELSSSTEIGVTNYSLTMDANETTDIAPTTTMVNDEIQEKAPEYVSATLLMSDDANVTSIIPENVINTTSDYENSDVNTPIPTNVNTTSGTHDTAAIEPLSYASDINEPDLILTTENSQGEIFESTKTYPMERNVPENTEETDLVATPLTTEPNYSISTTTMPSVTIAAPNTTNNYETTTEMSNETLESIYILTTTDSNDVQTTTDYALEIKTWETTTTNPVLSTISPYFADITLSPDYYSMFDLPKGEEARELIAEAQDLMKQQFESAKFIDAVNKAQSYDNAKSIFDDFLTDNFDTINNDDDDTDNDDTDNDDDDTYSDDDGIDV